MLLGVKVAIIWNDDTIQHLEETKARRRGWLKETLEGMQLVTSVTSWNTMLNSAQTKPSYEEELWTKEFMRTSILRQ